MNKVEGLWEDVLVGFFVQDKNGKWWKVRGWDLNGEPELVDADGNQVTLGLQDGHKAVTYMYDPKTLIEQTLDGKEIS